MTMISQADFSKATGTAKLPGLAPMLMKLLDIHSFNTMMDHAGDLEGIEFTEYILDFLGVKIKIDEADLANIPEKGAFIAVANHPYGAVESLALLSLLVSRRPDTLFMGNFLLKRIPNLAKYIIAVNPFDKIKDASSIGGIKTTLCNLKAGTPVAIFPAGEVAAYNFKAARITDREWHPVVGKIIAKAQVPVLPVYFHGDNGVIFSLLRYIHPALQTVRIPAEMFNKKGMTLHVRIGKPVMPNEFATSPNTHTLLSSLRETTYGLKCHTAQNLKLKSHLA